MRNENTTTRFSAAELREGKRAGSRTDLERVRRMPEAELEARIAADPDWKRVPRDWHLKADAAMPVRKRLVSVRLDGDVLEWFRGEGAGYQTRINAVLRAFVAEEKRRRAG